MWTGLVVVLLVSIVFMGPGLWSESLDYPVINWVRRKLGGGPAPKDGDATKAAAPAADSTKSS